MVLMSLQVVFRLRYRGQILDISQNGRCRRISLDSDQSACGMAIQIRFGSEYPPLHCISLQLIHARRKL